MSTTSGSSTIEIDARPETVYELLTDLSRVGELSPECWKAEWTEGSTEAVVGAKFLGHNRVGENEWQAGCEVVAATPSQEWAFKVPAPNGSDTVWRYEITATDDGCTVTETFDAPILTEERFVKMNRHAMLLGNISGTLKNLKAVAEAE